MPPAVERKLLGKLAEIEPQLVRDIRRAMFGVDVAVSEERNTEARPARPQAALLLSRSSFLVPPLPLPLFPSIASMSAWR